MTPEPMAFLTRSRRQRRWLSVTSPLPPGLRAMAESQRLWRLDRVKNAIGSGVIHDGHLYTISADGIASCLDLKTGNKVWEERLQGSSSRGSSWSSMLLAG